MNREIAVYNSEKETSYYLQIREVLSHIYEESGLVGVLSSMLFLAFSKKQREAIRDVRDGGRCHFPARHDCNEREKVEVHHIYGQRACIWIGIDPDFPENAITICSNSHDLVHPDRVKAKRNYWPDRLRGKDSYKSLGVERDEKLRNHELYWVQTWDEDMKRKAIELTKEAESECWVFPPVNRKKK